MAMKKMMQCVGAAIVLAGLTACAPKTEAYFKNHPEEVQPIAKACIQKSREGKDIGKDATCMAVVHYQVDWCHVEQRLGNPRVPPTMDCDDLPYMLWMASSGYDN